MKHVALAMGLSDYYDHGIARGIIRYAKSRHDWQLYGYGWMFSPLEDVFHWSGDGILARIEYRTHATAMESVTCPIVDVANAFPSEALQTVCNDDYRTGNMAARHLLEHDFRSFAYCGVADVAWSGERLRGFLDGTRMESVPAFARPLRWWLTESHSQNLATFLRTLAAGTALFCCNDKVGLRVNSLCRTAGIPVPGRIALLGVDNEDIPCELAEPGLSSIELQTDAIGFAAAERLDLLMSGRNLPSSTVTIPPAHVVERSSSTAYSGTDPVVESALRIIHSSGGYAVSVGMLVDTLGVGRRSLESRFKRELGQTVYRAIVARRIARAQKLLRESTRTVEAIASDVGFGSVHRFHAQFKRHTATTPGRYRLLKRNRTDNLPQPGVMPYNHRP